MGKRSRSRSRSRSRRDHSRRRRSTSRRHYRSRSNSPPHHHSSHNNHNHNNSSRSNNNSKSSASSIPSTHQHSGSSTSTSTHRTTAAISHTRQGTTSSGGRGRSPPRPIPQHAPRLKVPSNIPVEVRTFIDLFCSFVVQGGPGVEEEIREREEKNPFFAFLSPKAKWNDPIVVYYRWRLYTTLQEGQRRALSWRTDPFQMEEGLDAVVWVPPPKVLHGVEFLSQYCERYTNAASAVAQQNKQKVSDWLQSCLLITRAFTVTESTPNTTADAVVVPVLVPAIEWSSRIAVFQQQAKFLTTLRKAELQVLMEKLDFDSVWQQTKGVGIKEQLHQFQQKVLASNFIAQRCSDALCIQVQSNKNVPPALHTVSTIVDMLTHYAGIIAAAASGLRRLHSLPQQTSESMEEIRSLSALLIRLLFCQLSLLFLLNDLGSNPFAYLSLDDDVEDGHESQPQQQQQRPSASTPPAPIAAALEICATTITECFLRSCWEVLAIPSPSITTTATTDGVVPSATTTTSLEVTMRNDLTGELLPPSTVHHDASNSLHDISVNVRAAVAVSSSANTTAEEGEGEATKWCTDTRAVAVQLLGWTRAVLRRWGEDTSVGGSSVSGGGRVLPVKAAMKLEFRYEFLLQKSVDSNWVAGN